MITCEKCGSITRCTAELCEDCYKEEKEKYKLAKFWRAVDGLLIHDGDCDFFSAKICTCGLLHYLKPKMMPVQLYGKFYDEHLSQHESHLDILVHLAE